uniref:Uncharacterized protein n=1 Tax=Glossina pallidipes TaxID=7398 RepID=A0A1A9ZZI1_GLOPL
MYPVGFKIVHLPYTSFVRHVDFKGWNSLENHGSDARVAICEKLIRKLHLKCSPSLLSDPKMDHLETKLLALAFDQKFETLGSLYFPDLQSQETVFAGYYYRNSKKYSSIDGVDLITFHVRLSARLPSQTLIYKNEFDIDFYKAILCLLLVSFHLTGFEAVVMRRPKLIFVKSEKT